MEMERKEHKRYTARTIALVLAASAVIALILEAATMFGSHIYSMLDFENWSKKRILVFFLVGLAGSIWFERRDGASRLKEAVSRVQHSWRGYVSRHWKNALGTIALAAIVGIAARLSPFGGDARIALIAVTVSTGASLFVLYRKQILESAEWGFLIICLCSGLVMCISVPVTTGVCWDDQIHYSNALSASYIIDVECSDAETDMASLFGKSEIFAEYAASPDSAGIVPLSREAADAIALQNDTMSQTPYHQLDGTQTLLGNSYAAPTMFGYIPNALGLWFGRLLHLPFSAVFVVGKLFGLLFYAIVFFFAIRSLKSGKHLVCAIGLLPTNVFMAANYAYDPWITSLCALAFCRFASMIQDDKREVRLSDALPICVPFVAGVIVKAVYAPLALIFLLVPKRKFESRGEMHRYRVAICIGFLLPFTAVVMPILVNLLMGMDGGSAQGASDTRGSTDVDSGGQVRFILSSPLQAFTVLATFTLEIFAPLNFIGGGLLNFPYIFGGVEDHIGSSNLPTAVVSPLFADGGYWEIRALSAGWLLLIVVLSFVDRPRPQSDATVQPSLLIGTLSAIIVSYCLVCEALYITFNAVGASTIDGVQYRYFYPFFIPFFLLCINTFSRIRVQRRPLGIASFSLVSILTLLSIGLVFLPLS